MSTRLKMLVPLLVLALAACSSTSSGNAAGPGDDNAMATMPGMSSSGSVSGGATGKQDPLPGMPPPLVADDLYAADRPNALASPVKGDLFRVYVPNLAGASVTVIDPTTYKVLETVKVGRGPQHVVPAWDMRTLWVNNNVGNSLTPIDPATGRLGPPVAVTDPYNLYFTPDGKHAIVMEEAKHLITFRDPHTMALQKNLPVSCNGVNHADFSPDGRYFVVSCEFSGDLVKVDTETESVLGQMHLPGAHPMPQDVKISPDGKTWYVADMQSSGVWVLNGDAFTLPRLLPTGAGAHGLYVSRDSKYLYITNRGEGSVSLLDFSTGKLAAKWQIPGGGSPDMGGLSPDGKVLWLSGRYDGVVYAMDTGDGHLIAKIKVGPQPHGLCIWPQPGRYSLGHTGVMR